MDIFRIDGERYWFERCLQRGVFKIYRFLPIDDKTGEWHYIATIKAECVENAAIIYQDMISGELNGR